MASQRDTLQTYTQKPRIFILTDISNEPDDAQSLVRYLLYANQFETEGLVACTSTWLRDRTAPEEIQRILEAYGEVVGNLNAHVHEKWQFPEVEMLRGVIRSGAEVYGMAAINSEAPLSPGAQLLYDRILAPSTQPLWVLCWGGTNTLAQVLLAIDDKYPPEDAKRLISRIRVYAISDQDDTGVWIRNNFPDVFYIASIHGWNQYGMAAWTGISGEDFYGFDQGGPDSITVSARWIKENVQLGPLGAVYPDFKYIPEGDTPTFLYLIQNGLGVPDCPDYGSWGGRYAHTDVSSDGVNGNHYSDVVDRVQGQDGKTYTSNHATIWRWRNAFQNDIAARIQWSLCSDFRSANHHPVVIVNGAEDLTPVRIDGEAGSTVILDASQTYDPDGDALTFKWWHYREPTTTKWWVDPQSAELEITPLDVESRKVEIRLPPPEVCAVDAKGKPVPLGQLLHLILEVRDSGTPCLTSYRRVLIQVTNKELRGIVRVVEAVGQVDETGANGGRDAMKD